MGPLGARQDDCANMATTWRSNSFYIGEIEALEVLAEVVIEDSLTGAHGSRFQSTYLKPLLGAA